MRAGWAVSAVGHVGFVMMTLLAWETRSALPANVGAVVPVEIVDVAPESNVRALAQPVEETATPEQQDQTTPEPTPAPAPEPAPAPPQRTQHQADEFDLASIARLVDHSRQTGRQRSEGAASDRTQQGAGLGTAERASLQDRVRALSRAHLRTCWRMPIDLPDPERLVVTVQFDLNRNGTLVGQPTVISPRNYTFDPAMRTAAEAALRAVRTCDFSFFSDDPVVGDHYEFWRQIEYTFRPEG
jgi:type IV secretory pathway VirB10-like protein